MTTGGCGGRRRGPTVAPRGAVRAAWARTREGGMRREEAAAAARKSQVARLESQQVARKGNRAPSEAPAPAPGTFNGPGSKTRWVESCFATQVRESPGLHRHAQMATAAARLPLQSRGTLLSFTARCMRRVAQLELGRPKPPRRPERRPQLRQGRTVHRRRGTCDEKWAFCDVA